jgi:hypothetical protein
VTNPCSVEDERVNVRLIPLLLFAACTSVTDVCPPNHVPIYAAGFYQSGGTYRDTVRAIDRGEALRIDSVLRVYGDSLTLGPETVCACIPERYARDTVLWINMLLKADDEEWLKENVRNRPDGP